MYKTYKFLRNLTMLYVVFHGYSHVIFLPCRILPVLIIYIYGYPCDTTHSGGIALFDSNSRWNTAAPCSSTWTLGRGEGVILFGGW